MAEPLTTSPEAEEEWIRRADATWRTLLKPPPRLTVSEWADRYRVLSPEASAEPGRWRTDRAPYLRGIMDAISDPLVRRICWIAASQVAKTELVLNVVGFHVDQDPAPILVVRPTLDDAMAWSKDRLSPMLRDSPALKGKVSSPRSRDSGNTLLHKQFAGGHLTIVGANSASGLASRPIRIVLLDEVDRFPPSAGTEGDPVSLAIQRASTFWNRKIVIVSTPTIKGLSRIEAEWDKSDQRRFYLACPHCDHTQTLAWPNLTWEKELVDEREVHRHEAATYTCEECGVLIDESSKHRMLQEGEWRAENPDGRFPGFHINALYSPWVRWPELVEKWVEAQGDVERLKTFINLQLGESWEDRFTDFKPESLASRAEEYPADVPDGVGVLTASVDVQGDRLELAVKGWGAGEESWLIGHHRLHGEPEGAEVWSRLENLLAKSYRTESGVELRILACMIDSGHLAPTVFGFVGPREGRNVWACKGQDGGAVDLLKRSMRANRSGVKVWAIGVHGFKDLLFRRLQIQRPGPGYMHFCQPTTTGADAEYFAQFGAEIAVRERTGGQIRRRWKQIRDRNEAIDLEVYAMAALHGLGEGVRGHLDAYAEAVRQGTDPSRARPTRRRKVRSKGVEV